MGRVTKQRLAAALATGALASGVLASAAHAGGVDRSGQPNSILFEEGNYIELSWGQVNPKVSGNDLTAFGGRPTQDVAGTHTLPGLAAKYQFTDKISGALILDQAYGADISYPRAAAGGSAMLGGTAATVDSQGFTALGRYKFNDAWSVHGGVRATKASANVTLAGLGYGALNGYNATLSDSWGTGYVLGAAWEKPEIAARVALTYYSKITHDFDTVEKLGAATINPGSVTSVDTPEALNLEAQTGIAKDTLLFGTARWVNWDQFLVKPTRFAALTGGQSITALNDTISYTLGVGRKFNDTWSGSVFATWENPTTGHGKISPLAPYDGYKGIGLAAVYNRDNMKVTMGVRFLNLGDAQPATGGTARAQMADNKATAFGLRVGYRF